MTTSPGTLPFEKGKAIKAYLLIVCALPARISLTSTKLLIFCVVELTFSTCLSSLLSFSSLAVLIFLAQFTTNLPLDIHCPVKANVLGITKEDEIKPAINANKDF